MNMRNEPQWKYHVLIILVAYQCMNQHQIKTMSSLIGINQPKKRLWIAWSFKINASVETISLVNSHSTTFLATLRFHISSQIISCMAETSSPSVFFHEISPQKTVLNLHSLSSWGVVDYNWGFSIYQTKYSHVLNPKPGNYNKIVK